MKYDLYNPLVFVMIVLYEYFMLRMNCFAKIIMILRVILHFQKMKIISSSLIEINYTQDKGNYDSYSF